jgi:hypothetical protein
VGLGQVRHQPARIRPEHGGAGPYKANVISSQVERDAIDFSKCCFDVPALVILLLPLYLYKGVKCLVVYIRDQKYSEFYIT